MENISAKSYENFGGYIMAEYTGKDGAVFLNSTELPVTAWDYSGSIDTYETTPVGSADKTYTQGPRDGSGSLTISTDPDNAQQKVAVDFLLTGQTPAQVLLQLYVVESSDDQLYMSAVIESIAFTQVAAGLQVTTVTYKKTGALFHVPTT